MAQYTNDFSQGVPSYAVENEDDFAVTADSDPLDYAVDDVPEEDKPHPLIAYLDQGNLVDELDKDDLGNAETAAKIMTLHDEAKESMGPWLKRYERAIMLAKMQASSNGKPIETKDFPFEGASLAMMPYITEAMLDFNSRAAPELVWAKDIVKVKVYGQNSEEKEARAERMATYQNYQLSESIPNWRDNQDQGIFIIACTGTIYKETYYDSDIQEVQSLLCLANEVIFNHSYKTFKEAPDKFKAVEYTRNDVIGFIRGEQQWDIEEDKLEEDKDDFKFTECYTWIDLDGDGLKEPYIATIWDDNSLIVHLVPYFDEESLHLTDDGDVIKIDALERFTQIKFLPDPEGGPMGMGWGILLGPMFDAINTNMRQLIDAGTIANTAGNSFFYSTGMVSGRSNSVESGPIKMRMGQGTVLQTRGGNLRDNIVQFPAAGPSATLFQMVDFLIESARRMTAASSTVEANSNMAASLYLAQLQQALKVPNSIIMRVYDGLKREQQKIGGLNFKHFSDEKYNRVIDDNQEASMQADFDPADCDVRLEADPSQGSDAERAARANAIWEEAKIDQSGMLNKREALLDWLKAMKTPNIEDLAPEPDPNAVDPTQKMILAQQQFEAELKKEDQELRRGELEVKKANANVAMQKAAMEAAREATKLGLISDKQEAEITNLYTQSIERLVNMGLGKDQALSVIDTIEKRYITAEGGE